jgi:hypothetical protein
MGLLPYPISRKREDRKKGKGYLSEIGGHRTYFLGVPGSEGGLTAFGDASRVYDGSESSMVSPDFIMSQSKEASA